MIMQQEQISSGNLPDKQKHLQHDGKIYWQCFTTTYLVEIEWMDLYGDLDVGQHYSPWGKGRKSHP